MTILKRINQKRDKLSRFETNLKKSAIDQIMLPELAKSRLSKIKDRSRTVNVTDTIDVDELKRNGFSNIQMGVLNHYNQLL